MMTEKGKDRVEPASREADPRDTEKSAAVGGDNDIDRIISQPDEESKKATEEAYFNTDESGKSETTDRNVKE